MSRRANNLTVEIPAPEADQPSWARVGIIAALGFAVGIAWPRLTGTRIAPSPPTDSPSPTPGAASPPLAPASADVAATSGSSSPPNGASPRGAAPVAAGAPAPAETVTVGRGSIFRCSDGKDEIKDECGALQFDPVAVPRLKELASCPGAAGLSGKLSVGFDIDFKHKGLHVQRGKSTTMAADPAEAAMKCVRNAFANVSFDDVPHEHRRYTIFYAATFVPPGKPADVAPEAAPTENAAAGSTTNESPASGNATVAWEVAILRDSPKSGAVVGRVLRGTKVKVLGHQNEWFRVGYGSDNREGWVYRGAIGL